MKWSGRSLARIGMLMGAAYMTMWACSPPNSLPPPVPLAATGHHRDIGIAGSLGALGYLDDFRGRMRVVDPLPAAAFDLYYRYEFNSGVSLGGTAFLGFPNMMGAGGHLQLPISQSDDFFIGARLEGGFLWTSLGVPMAWHLGDQRWLYTTPSIGMRPLGMVVLPVGISRPMGDSARLNTEVHITTSAVPGLQELGYMEDSTLVYLVVGYSWLR